MSARAVEAQPATVCELATSCAGAAPRPEGAPASTSIASTVLALLSHAQCLPRHLSHHRQPLRVPYAAYAATTTPSPHPTHTPSPSPSAHAPLQREPAAAFSASPLASGPDANASANPAVNAALTTRALPQMASVAVAVAVALALAVAALVALRFSLSFRHRRPRRVRRRRVPLPPAAAGARGVLRALLRPAERGLRAVKTLAWDVLLFPLAAWVLNLLSVVVAVVVSGVHAACATRRNHLNVCVAATTTATVTSTTSTTTTMSTSTTTTLSTTASSPDAARAASLVHQARRDDAQSSQRAFRSNVHSESHAPSLDARSGVAAPASPMLHAEATHLSRRKHHTSLSPYFSALMVPSALSFSRPRKSLVLDLDETLVHSQFKPTDTCDLRLEVRVDDFPAVFYVSKRPHLDVFLRTVAQWYDVIIFTASLQKYGDPLITVLDSHRVVKRRIFRQHCLRRNGNFVKDLTIVNPNLADVVIVDNSPAAYSIQPSNAIPIETWYHDQNDEELLNLLPLLHALAFLNDVRSLLDLRLTGGALIARKTQQQHSEMHQRLHA